VHIGHLAAAVECRHALDLDRVLLMVANQPWQKVGSRDITPAEDRYAVVAAAVADIPGLEASRLEIDRGGATYTADTLLELRHLHPDAELVLIVGSDLADELHTWARADEVRSLATLAVVTRPGSEVPPSVEGWGVTAVPVPALDVSSTDLRQRAAAGRPIDVLIPPAAVHCIHRLGLYAGPR
jgi:nicotinate-nucleotide adenylyltransferase